LSTTEKASLRYMEASKISGLAAGFICKEYLDLMLKV
jgi:hypothetical protein